MKKLPEDTETLIHSGWLLLISLALAMTLISCEPQPEPPKTPTPEVSEAARTALVDWLECEECSENQLKGVLEYSELLQPMLVSSLRHGAAPTSKALYRHQLEQRYDKLVAYSQDHPNAKPTLDKKAFVELYLGNFDAQYRSRAAEALGAIGGDTAREALQQALGEKQREDVMQSIKTSLEGLR